MENSRRPSSRTSTAAWLAPRELAFVRSWAEGLDLAAAWARYLQGDGAADARRARSELQGLLDGLRSQARALGRPDIAALLRRDPEAMVDAAQAQPTLDEFRAGLAADHYSEAELLELYQARFGRDDARSAARRRQRLRQRQLLALQWLERQDARQPRPGDAVAAWFDDRVAQRLAAVGVVSLGDLLALLRRKGPRWHRGVPKMGPQGAARIQGWLQQHEASLGAALPAPALPPAPAAQPGIVPLERLLLPAALDGSRGLNRGPAARCSLSVANDLQAVQAWLQQHGDVSHTWRAYRKEAERFLLWAVIERRKPLSSLDGEDCAAYSAFLEAPAPGWTGPRQTGRSNGAWRPFEGPLSCASRAVAVAIVRSLCGWLVRQHYLAANPWQALARRAAGMPAPPQRALSPAQWKQVDRWLDRRGPLPARRRLRFVLRLAYLTGLRLAELAAARVAWLRQETLAGRRVVWSLRVPGRRGDERDVPLPDAAVESFREYLTDRGLDRRILSNDPATPLIARLDGPQALSAARLYEVLVQGFEQCAADLSHADPAAAARIGQASTHWLRHSHALHAAARGVPQDVLQARLGHRSAASTSVYAATG